MWGTVSSNRTTGSRKKVPSVSPHVFSVFGKDEALHHVGVNKAGKQRRLSNSLRAPPNQTAD